MSTLSLNLSLLNSYLGSLGYQVDSAPNAWNILGIRSAVPGPDPATIQQVPEQFDRYNDTLIVFGTQNGQPLCRCFLATVDPGRFYTEHPLNRKGCAHLLNGQYRYTIGKHHISSPNGYPALVQAGKVKIWRDQNRNFLRDGCDGVETGFFGVNIHAGGTATEVGRQSAGCQVIKGGRYGAPWRSFMNLMNRDSNSRFWYSLVDAADLIEYHNAREFGDGRIDPGSATLPEKKRNALQQMLSGIAMLYDYQGRANLSEEEGVSFLALLNRLRKTGLLANLKPDSRPPVNPNVDEDGARQAMLSGFRLIYMNLVDSGLDHAFHARLNQLRHFGPLATL